MVAVPGGPEELTQRRTGLAKQDQKGEREEKPPPACPAATAAVVKNIQALYNDWE